MARLDGRLTALLGGRRSARGRVVFWQSVQKHIFGSAASVDYDGSEVSLGDGSWDESQMSSSSQLARQISADSTVMPAASGRDSVDGDGTQGLLEVGKTLGRL